MQSEAGTFEEAKKVISQTIFDTWAPFDQGY